MQKKPLRFAVFGCGFWSRFQIAGWREAGGVELTALYSRNREHGLAAARQAGIAPEHVYTDAAELLRNEPVEFVDIITNVETHRAFTELAAAHGRAVISQKPMSTGVTDAAVMLAACAAAGVPLFVHENWRWQAPIRALHAELASGRLGAPHRARVTYSTSFPVFDNQPFLRDLDQFILTDIGTHILDTARFLFGEADELYCQTRRVNRGIRGEDVATVMLRMGGGTTVTCEMSYASPVEHDRFPETYVLVECERGSLELGPDFWLKVTAKGEGTLARRVPPPRYAWADPRYDVVHASICACNQNLLKGLRGEGDAETTGADNLRTLRLVHAAYESAARHAAIRLPETAAAG